ncbi:uncharacterized protein BDV14DRAFT_182885 [Aspergillus stella-maris]|uniref:uncharacterized protein n=1 Tax=Aspergillus stella-maris TaxID=1810926 RepID=UPI003CCE203E
MEKNQSEQQWLEDALEAPPPYMSISPSYTIEQLRKDLYPPSQQGLSQLTADDLPETTSTRQQASTSAQSLDQDEYLPAKLALCRDAADDSALPLETTVLYLAYGSNLASETFLGMRGIKPLSQLNVVVPELRLTFDLPGVPYIEPCFAGTHFRSTLALSEDEKAGTNSEEHTLLPNGESDQDHYSGPLIGVVYEVTLRDYATIIATEGGGRGYKDIVIASYPFPKGYDPADPIPERPTTQPVKAHTLLSPAALKDLVPLHPHPFTQSRSTSLSSPRYMQPSARYLNLIRTGAAEHNLPFVYREYLAQLQPYRITSLRQKIGMGLFLVMWGPFLLAMLVLQRVFARPDGRSPEWVGRFMDFVKVGMWSTYEQGFKRVFGDGEKTVER